MSAFTASSSEQHPTDLAGLRGARLVTAIETEDGTRWAESKIKSLTGGDRISARFMRQDFFEYVPQFKLIVAGNHKPGLRSVDEAIRRRLHLVPFTVTIPERERDPELGEKLKAPKGLVRIRYFGLFANRRREPTLARCRQLLGAVACADRPEPTTQPRCPACSGTMLVIERMTSAQLYSRLDLSLPTLQRCYVDSSQHIQGPRRLCPCRSRTCSHMPGRRPPKSRSSPLPTAPAYPWQKAILLL